jgi:rod shape-determining protein MreD
VTTALAFALVYVLFLVQASAGPWMPDLVLITLAVFALNRPRVSATALGFAAGLCFDLTAPAALGAGIAAFSAVGYVGSALRDRFYHGPWSVVVLVCAGLALRHGLALVAGLGLAPLPALACSVLLTAALAPLGTLVLGRVFTRG